MPMHDWTRVDPNDYHTFHLMWLVSLASALNHKHLPEGYYAMADHTTPPLVRRRLAIKQARDRQIVSVIEIVSPGDKAKLREFALLVEDLVRLLQNGIHLMIIDPFPTNSVTSRVWEQFTGKKIDPIQGRAASLISCQVGVEDKGAFVDEVAVGGAMPDMPLFLGEDIFVHLPLEETYTAAWNGFPEPLREVLL